MVKRILDCPDLADHLKIPGAPGSEPAFKESVAIQNQLPNHYYEGIEAYNHDGLEPCTTSRKYSNAKVLPQLPHAYLNNHTKIAYVDSDKHSSSQFVKGDFADPYNTPESKPLWRRKRFISSLLIIMLVIIVVVVPLAILIPKRGQSEIQTSDSTTQTPDSSSRPSNPTLASLSNVMMNTRMATTWDREVGVMLFYQTVDGRIHYVQVSSDQQFQGSRDINVLDAKNNTPLAATWSQEPDGVKWNLFYLDIKNVIQMAWSPSDHNNWQVSRIRDERWKAASDPDITFAAVPGTEYDSRYNRPGGGKTLLVCTEFDELRPIYLDASYDWNYGNRIGSVCGRKGNTATREAITSFFRLVDDRVEFWTKDFAEDEAIDVWDTDGPPSPFTAANPGNICAHGSIFAYLTPENTIRGSNFTYLSQDDGGGMQWNHEYPIRDGSELLQDSALGCVNFVPQAGQLRSTHIIFYQLQNGTIQAAIGTPPGTFVDVPAVEPSRWEFVNVRT